MKKSFILALLLMSLAVQAQTVELKSVKQPFYRVIEWKGMGTITLSRDPSFTQQQVDMEMVGLGGKPIWHQVLNPMVKEPHYISEDGGKYAYFLEHLEPQNGKIFVHQLSAAGNIKTKNLDFLAAVKLLGKFPINELEVVDIVTTNKALVWLFKYTDKSSEKFYTIAVSVTHHNFNMFAHIVSENATGKSKEERQIAWYLAGEDGDNLVYAARVHAGKEAGWKIKKFSPKGLQIEELVLDQRGTNFLSHNRIGFSRRGSALLKRIEPSEKGTLIFAEGSYYVGGVESDGSTTVLHSYKWEGKEWKSFRKSSVSGYNPKKELEVGYFKMSEGMGWFVRNGAGIGHFHPFVSESTIVSGPIEQDTYNPSRLLTADFPTKFVEDLGSSWLVFDPKQLPAKNTITVEFIQK